MIVLPGGALTIIKRQILQDISVVDSCFGAKLKTGTTKPLCGQKNKDAGHWVCFFIATRCQRRPLLSHSPLWPSCTGRSRARSEGSPCPRSRRSGRDPGKQHTCHPVVPSSTHTSVPTRSSRSPPRMRRGRWSRGLPGTAWPPSHPQTGDCPPMSATGGK